MNSNTDRTNALNGFYAYKNTFDDKTTWVDIPTNLTFYNTMDPYNDDPGTPSVHARASSREKVPHSHAQDNQWIRQEPSIQQSDIAAHGLETLSAAALNSSLQANLVPGPASSPPRGDSLQSSTPNQRDIAQLVSPPTALACNNLINILNAPQPGSRIDPSLTSADAQLKITAPSYLDRGQQHVSEHGMDSDHKVTYLFNHFSETPGQLVSNGMPNTSDGS
ncbi:MAG: hypothetical protein Q9163_002540 [Psora crenata]